MTLEPKRLVDDRDAGLAELREGLGKLRGCTAAPEQMAKLAAGLVAAGVSLGAAPAQAAGTQTGAQVASEQVAAKTGVSLGWKLGVLGAVVGTAMVALVPWLPGLTGAPQATGSQTTLPGSAPVGGPVTVPHAQRLPRAGDQAKIDSHRQPRAGSAGEQAQRAPSEGANPSAAAAQGVALPSSPPLEGSHAAPGSVAGPSPAAEKSGSARSTATSRVAQQISKPAVSTQGTPSGLEAPRRSEVELLQTASTVLGSNPGEALSLCEEHRANYPKGAMSQEREVIAITALVRLGRGEQAAERAKRFRSNYPTSAYSRQLDQLQLGQ